MVHAGAILRADVAEVVPWQMGAWAALWVASALAAAICAGAEIGIFSLSRVRLRLRVHHQDAAALTLQSWLARPTYVLEGLLVLQNVFGFLFSAATIRLLASLGWSEWMQAVVSTVVITPVILIFCDIAPKDLFNTHADRWMYRLVPALRVAFGAMTLVPVLPIVRALSAVSTRLFTRGRTGETQLGGPRTEILNLFQESAASGLVTATQQDLVQRALRMAHITIREVMIPWGRVVGVPAAISADGFRALVQRYNVSRLPVLGRTATEVLGLIEVLDVLGDPAGFALARHLRPAMTLIGEQSVRSAITLMQRARQTIAVVVDRQGRAIGLVTMKDLIEELVGDLENW